METLTLKNYLQENREHLRRIILTFFIIFFFFTLLIARATYLQVYHHNKYESMSKDNRIGVIPIPPTRGLIFDRNGVILAKNSPTFSLEIIPESIKRKDIDKLLSELQQILPIREEDLERFHKLKKQKRSFDSIALKNKLTLEEVARFSVEQHRFPGVSIEARLSRDYPYNELFAHVMGYVGRINNKDLEKIDSKRYRATHHIGKIGLERYYENSLHGEPGYQQVELNARGRVIKVLEKSAPTPGNNITLTIDVNLQKIAYNALKDYRGAAIAINTQTGEVLTMVSTPSYDPNLFINGISNKNYNALRDSLDKPLYNRAIQGRYPPGSTIKPFVSLAGLHYNLVTPAYTIRDPGWYVLASNPDHRYRDWRKKGHGKVNLGKAITESCDTYFYHLGHKMGITRWHDFMLPFGFSEKTNIDMKEENKSILPSPAWKKKHHKQAWFPGETLNVSIGQGFMVTTPIQLANATVTLANKGKGFKPFLVKSYQPHEQEVHKILPQKTHDITLDPIYWNEIQKAMEDVIHKRSGTAYGISRGIKYKMAGKSGTAQVFSIKQGEEYNEEEVDLRLRDHALFVAFAPSDNPQIAVAVIVENGGSGSKVAAPIVRKIIDTYLESQP